jgi:hypothetical protein
MLEYPLISVGLIGWIPYYRHLSRLPPGPAKTAIFNLSWRKRAGYDLVFYSGNKTPPSRIVTESSEGASKFKAYLKKKDYRGALALWDVVLKIPAPDAAYVEARSITLDEEVGYTPIRSPLLRSKLALGHMKGRGRTDSEDDKRKAIEGGVQYTHEATFQVGEKGNRGSRLFFGYDVPYVWMRVTYRVDFGTSLFTGISTCKLGISLAGTYIPSQRHWVQAFTHAPDMLNIQSSPLHTHSVENNDLERFQDVFENRNEIASLFFLCEESYTWDVSQGGWKRNRSARYGLP